MAKKLLTANNQATGSIKLFKIYPPKGVDGDPIDVRKQVPEIRYYEDVLSNAITMTCVITDTGGLDPEGKKPMNGIIDGLPIRGGCRVDVQLVDPNKGSLNFTGTSCLYVHRIVAGSPGTQKDVFQLELCSLEYLKNEQIRIRKSYTGKISDTVEKILTADGLETKKEFNIDQTLRPYRFIGNTWKPFRVCTWLAAKANPDSGIGHQAGYLFFETHDGFNFKSVDKLLSVKPEKKYIYANTAFTKKDYYKVQTYRVEKNIDMNSNMMMGTYNNKTIYFDLISLKWKTKGYDLTEQDGNLTKAADSATGLVSSEWTEGTPPTRYFYQTLDTGFQPQGRTPKQQVGNLKSDPKTPQFDAEAILVQSSMRYSELFSIKTHITILGDFDLRAGQMIECEFPDLQETENKKPNQQSSGNYMIASICHRLTPSDCHSSITLVRDSLPEKRTP